MPASPAPANVGERFSVTVPFLGAESETVGTETSMVKLVAWLVPSFPAPSPCSAVTV